MRHTITLYDLLNIIRAAGGMKGALSPASPMGLGAMIYHWTSSVDGKAEGGFAKVLRDVADDPKRCQELASAIASIGYLAEHLCKIEVEMKIGGSSEEKES